MTRSGRGMVVLGSGVVGWMVGPAAGRLLDAGGLLRPFCWSHWDGVCSPPPHPLGLHVSAALVLMVGALLGVRRLALSVKASPRSPGRMLSVIAVALLTAGVVYGVSNAVVPQNYAFMNVEAQRCQTFGQAWEPNEISAVSYGSPAPGALQEAKRLCVSAARSRVGVGVGVALTGVILLLVRRGRPMGHSLSGPVVGSV